MRGLNMGFIVVKSDPIQFCHPVLRGQGANERDWTAGDGV
jgi:hypothetical protein